MFKLLFVFFVMMLGVSSWAMWCNWVTYRQMKTTLDGITRMEDVRVASHLLSDFRRVDYDSVFYARLFFQDWRRLYPASVRNSFPELFK